MYWDQNFPKRTMAIAFVLVVISNATRYLYALPSRNLNSETISNELMKLFTFIGIPKIIRSDNAAPLESQLITSLYNKLGIKAEYSAHTIRKESDWPKGTTVS
jgi:hypothetical protein